jgi:uncharacterized delta-60 repeat protein
LGRFFSDGAIPGVGFSRGDYSVNESAGEATIDVTRTGDPSQPLSVNYRTADGSAVAGTNYIARSGTLHFGSFEQTQTLHLPLLDDALVKGNQTVHLSLSSPSPGVVLSGFAQAILTIQDHEIPTTLLDPDFVPPAFGSGGNYETILPLSDGTILAGGVFSSSTGNSFSGAFLRPDGSAASTFRPALGLPGNLEIRALALQPDGSRLVAGFTDSDNGMSRTMFRFRMQPDGTLDGNGTSKLSSTNQWGGVSVSAMLFQPDGKLVVGGTFGFANQQKQAGLARFNPDGSTDESFDGGGGLLIHTATADERPGTANWLALQPDGKMLVAGFFTSLHGFSINNLARLNPDGSVDPSFVPSYLADGRVAGPVALQADGKVISAAGGSLVRLNSDGILDPSFQFNSEGVTEFAALAVAPDGRILASAGFYDTAQGNTTNRLLIVRADGSIELGQEMVFQDGGVTTISFDRNGRILVGGTFSAVNGAPRAGIARLLADGVGKPAVQFAVSDVLVGEDGGTATVTVLRTGNATGPLSVDFTTASGSAKAGVAFTPQSGTLQFGPLETRKTITIPIHDDLAVESNVQFRVILTNAANGVVLGGGPSAEVITIYDAERPGAVDFSFNPTIGGRVRAVAPQPDGKVLVSLFGNITNSLTGQLTSLFRLQSDGQVDSSFQAVLRFRLGGGAELDYPSSIVDALALQPNGKILVGGILSATNAASGQSNLPRIVRLNPNGTPDPDFHIPAIPDGEVQAVAIQSDGKIVIGGTFSMVDDVIRIGLARLTADGQVDTSFDGGTSFGGVPQLPFVWIPALVDTILVQADGKILIGGSFTNYQGVIRNGLVRINADASIDATLNPGDGPAISSTSPALVTSILDLPDGRKLVGGNFESWNGQARPGLARLNGDGTLDASFPHDLFLGTLGNYNQGIQLALQSDGRVLIANNDDFYATKSPINRANIARLNLDGTLDPSFDPGSGSGCCGRSIAALAVLPNGQILVAGDFASFDEVPRLGLVHLHGDPPLHIAAIAAGSNDDDAQLTLSALPKRSYVLEASANLTTWLPVRTNIATGYSLKFSDSEAMGWPLRFYRARQSVP